MATKKVKGKITFLGENLKLDLTSTKKKEIINRIKNNEKINIINFSEEEILLGKNRKITHIDHIRLKLISNASYKFENSISSGSYYIISYHNLSDFENIICVYNNGEIKVNGEILFKIGIKDIVYNDFNNNGLILFDSISIRVGVDLLTFSKYGENWMQEQIDRNLYSSIGDTNFLINRPLVKLN